MKRRLLTMAVILVLLLGLSPRADAVDIKVYQLALNERFMDNELTPTNMPVNVNGTIYIPYTAFDRTITGVDLGVLRTGKVRRYLPADPVQPQRHLPHL